MVQFLLHGLAWYEATLDNLLYALAFYECVEVESAGKNERRKCIKLDGALIYPSQYLERQHFSANLIEVG